MKRLPEETNPPDLLGWFAACLLLSCFVVAAFLLLGDYTSPAKARLVAVPQVADRSLTVAAGCLKPSDGGREICPPGRNDTQVVVSGSTSGMEPRL